jgi:hypothetical protein
MPLRPLAVLLALVTAAACGDDPPSFADAGPSLDAAPPDGEVIVEPDAAIDPEPPDTTITSGPPALAITGSATFTFEATEPATFRCALDDAEAAPCTSPHTVAVADGAHSLTVTAVDLAGNADTTPAVHDWTVDTTPPETTITEAPPAADNAVDTRVTFASEDGARFECALDGATLAACTSPHPLTGLADGGHTFTVRAIDAAGNPDPSPATHAWSVDASTPDTRIDSGPDGTVASRTASIAFSSPDAGAGATFECSLDGARFTACTSPRALSALTDGEHTFAVRVRDAAGNADPSPSTRRWVVDVTPPVLTLTGPDGAVGNAVADATPTFTFSAADASAVAFRCRLDDAAAACTSPHTTATLADGPHTITVVVTDAAGLTDTATIDFVVDTAGPAVRFLRTPPGGWPLPTFRFEFGLAAPEAGDSLECSLDSVAFAACTSPRAVTVALDTRHSLAIRGVDRLGNRGAIVDATWTPTAGLVLHYPLDRDADNHSLLAPDHPLVSRPIFIGGYAGGAATLPEPGASTDSAIPLGAGTGYTIALWALVPGVGTATLLDSLGDGGCALTVVRSMLSLVCNGAGAGELGRVDAALPASQWASVVVRYAEPGAAVELWVDGAPVGTIANPTRAEVFAPRQRRAAVVGPLRAPYRIDDVRVYDRTFDDAALCTDVLRGIAGERCIVPRPGLELGFEGVDPGDLATLVDTGTWDLEVVARTELAAERAVFGDGVIMAGGGGAFVVNGVRAPLASAEDHTLSMWFRARGEGSLIEFRCLPAHGCEGQGGLGVELAGEALRVCAATPATGERCETVRVPDGRWTHLMITSDGRRVGRQIVTDRLVIHVDGAAVGTIDFGGEGNVFANTADAVLLPVNSPGLALDEVELWPADLARTVATACELGLGGELAQGRCLRPPTP